MELVEVLDIRRPYIQRRIHVASDSGRSPGRLASGPDWVIPSPMTIFQVPPRTSEPLDQDLPSYRLLFRVRLPGPQTRQGGNAVANFCEYHSL